ncbi:hypothetical protein Sjap_005088 [Stephania japonica]|uniref:Uncharacterized protein n=1 Tax=Stephania japonica TaxID=461633 RepID=A0AAP0K5T3_9MAGN
MSAIPLESVEVNEVTSVEDYWSELKETLVVSLHEPYIEIAQNEEDKAEKEIKVISERSEEQQKESKEDQPLVLFDSLILVLNLEDKFPNKLSAGITELLGIHGIHIPNRRGDPIGFEETTGGFSSDEEGEFQDKEKYVNFDESPEFNDDQGVIKDTVVVFGDEDRATIIPMLISS